MRIDWFRILPLYWFQTRDTSWSWDAELNHLMDEGCITELTEFTATISGVEIWIENYPHSFGHEIRIPFAPIPSVATRKRLIRLVNEFRSSENRGGSLS